jgi:hypothetical protein
VEWGPSAHARSLSTQTTQVDHLSLMHQKSPSAERAGVYTYTCVHNTPVPRLSHATPYKPALYCCLLDRQSKDWPHAHLRKCAWASALSNNMDFRGFLQVKTFSKKKGCTYISLTKKPMKPMIRKPAPVAKAILENSAREERERERERVKAELRHVTPFAPPAGLPA